MSEHTKGPWELHPYNARMGSLISFGDLARGGNIANVFALLDADRAMANARLIAAAPELLEALKSAETAEAALIGEWADFWDVAPQPLIDKLMKAQELRNAAIGKAEGHKTGHSTPTEQHLTQLSTRR